MQQFTDTSRAAQVEQYLAALKRGYELLAEAAAKAEELGTNLPQRLKNEINIGRWQALELTDALETDAENVLNPPYLPLFTEAIASQSRALAWVEMAFLEASQASEERLELTEELAEVNRDAAAAAASLSHSWADLWELVQQAEAHLQDPMPMPRTVTLGGMTITLRRMAQIDGPLILGFARSLPQHDLLFLRQDITQPAQVETWLRDVAEGRSDTVLALRDDELLAYATVVSDGVHWTRHVRELRVMVAPSARGIRLGRLLTEQAFAIAKQQGVRKMIAQMTTDQEAAMAVFRSMGFEPEARLSNHVMDRDGELHDLQLMSLDVDAFEAKLEAALAEPIDETV